MTWFSCEYDRCKYHASTNLSTNWNRNIYQTYHQTYFTLTNTNKLYERFRTTLQEHGIKYNVPEIVEVQKNLNAFKRNYSKYPFEHFENKSD